MTKRNVIATVLIVIVLLIVCGIAVACPEKKEEKVQYDYQLKIAVQEKNDKGYYNRTCLEEIVLNDELHVEREYDGKTYGYILKAYNMPEHPRWSDFWIAVQSSGDESFYQNFTYFDTDGNFISSVKEVRDKGTYIIAYRCSALHGRFINKEMKLYIEVK